MRLLSKISASDKLGTFNAMVLIATVLYHVSDWRFALPIYSLAVAGFVLDRAFVLHHWLFWTTLSTILLSYLVISWPLEGNNYYLFFYLSLVSLVASFRQSFEVVRVNCRLLIGLVFACAAFWKIVSSSYFSGEFFRYTLISDPRLTQITQLLFQEPNLKSVPAASPHMFELLVQSLSWGGLLLETTIALCFLLPWHNLQYVRDLLLLLFCVVGYALLPVPAFGMMLTCMGYGQSQSSLQPLYLVLFVAMPLSTLRTFL